MELCLIWAQDRKGAIGRDNRVPWHLPEDRLYFRQVTMGCPVVMGRKTWEAIGSKPLEGRMNIVLTHSRPGSQLAGAVRAAHLNDALSLAGTAHPAKVFIIGGAQVYARTLPVAQRVYVTEVDTEIADADTFAPALSPQQWRLHREGPTLLSSTGLRYRMLEYEAVRRPR